MLFWLPLLIREEHPKLEQQVSSHVWWLQILKSYYFTHSLYPLSPYQSVSQTVVILPWIL